MSDSDDEAVLECSMLDDVQWRLRPGYRFPHLLSYDELCEFVNMEARKIGADPFRVKRRRMIQVEGDSKLVLWKRSVLDASTTSSQR